MERERERETEVAIAYVQSQLGIHLAPTTTTPHTHFTEVFEFVSCDSLMIQLMSGIVGWHVCAGGLCVCDYVNIGWMTGEIVDRRGWV